MKVLYCEDLANRTSPESCGGDGNIAAEALTGENVGGTLSSEITFSGCRPCACMGKAISTMALMRVMEGPGGVLASWHAWMPSARESGDPGETRYFRSWNRGIQPIKIPWCSGVHSPQCKPGTRNRGAGIGWGDHTFTSQCLLEVGQQHSTEEASEQWGTYRPGGVCGGKGVD